MDRTQERRLLDRVEAAIDDALSAIETTQVAQHKPATRWPRVEHLLLECSSHVAALRDQIPPWND